MKAEILIDLIGEGKLFGRRVHSATENFDSRFSRSARRQEAERSGARAGLIHPELDSSGTGIFWIVFQEVSVPTRGKISQKFHQQLNTFCVAVEKSVAE